MAAETDNTKGTTTPWKVTVLGIVVICAIGVLWLYSVAVPDTSPWRASNLRDCTRVEIEYQPSALEYFEVLAANPGLLSLAEREYLQSLQKSTLTDRQMIRWVASWRSRASYSELAEPKAEKRAYIKIRGYRDDECMASFGMYNHRYLVTDDGETFYPREWLDVVSCVLELNSFRMRDACAQRLLKFAELLNLGPAGTRIYVEPSEWCETIWPVVVPSVHNPPPVEYLRKKQTQERERNGEYRCPSGGAGRCHYAMNPDWQPNSPPDMVLMFEARAGWDQHGGPELFTFDHHHDPRGGCVLLNDGTVKFIRTEEELKQLRWK
jgi:hypothetical protein